MKVNQIVPMLCFALVLLTACTKHTTAPAGAGTLFPNSLGSQWTYLHTDSLTGMQDTVRKQVGIPTVFQNGIVANTWTVLSKSGIDTFYVYVHSDTVDEYASNQVLDTRYLLPLSVGNGWRTGSGTRPRDSIYVVQVDSISTPAAIFVNAYRLHRQWGGFNVYGSSSIWLVPYVGEAEVATRTTGFSYGNDSWVLLSFSITQ